MLNKFKDRLAMALDEKQIDTLPGLKLLCCANCSVEIGTTLKSIFLIELIYNNCWKI